jgi:hypothetical protein
MLTLVNEQCQPSAVDDCTLTASKSICPINPSTSFVPVVTGEHATGRNQSTVGAYVASTRTHMAAMSLAFVTVGVNDAVPSASELRCIAAPCSDDPPGDLCTTPPPTLLELVDMLPPAVSLSGLSIAPLPLLPVCMPSARLKIFVAVLLVAAAAPCGNAGGSTVMFTRC